MKLAPVQRAAFVLLTAFSIPPTLWVANINSGIGAGLVYVLECAVFVGDYPPPFIGFCSKAAAAALGVLLLYRKTIQVWAWVQRGE